MQELHLLGIVIMVFIGLLFLTYLSKIKKEGFWDANDDAHREFNASNIANYNNVNTALTVKKRQGVLGTDTRSLFGNIIDTLSPSGDVVQKIDNPYPLSNGKSKLFDQISKCEAVKTTDCSAFDDPSFTADCGLCLDIGKNSDNQPATGGLVLLPEDKAYAQQNKKGNSLPSYVPTIGFCPAKKMVGTKAECLRVQNELNCQKGQTFGAPNGCSQCYGDSSYSMVDPSSEVGLVSGSGILRIIGVGRLNYAEAGQPDNSGIINLKSDEPFEFILAGPELNNITLNLTADAIPEVYDNGRVYVPGERIIFAQSIYELVNYIAGAGYSPTYANANIQASWKRIMAQADYRNQGPPYIAGYLTGITGDSAGDEVNFNIDLYRIILNDSLTGRKPRTIKGLTMKNANADVAVTQMGPGFGQKGMNLLARSPFTFVDPQSQESTMCAASPFITQQASSEFLNSDPCYKSKGADGKTRSAPGNYTVECLQGMMTSSGCTQYGSAYPTDKPSSTTLSMDSSGNARSLKDIAELVYAKAVLAASGVDINGTSLSVEQWSEASVFCTGIAISSPCDTSVRDTGPLSTDCIKYLWDNQGENKQLGTTYSAISYATSLFSDTSTKNRRFCNRNGTLSPVNPNGSDNLSNIAFWKTKGGVNEIKRILSGVHKTANDPSISEDIRRLTMGWCYGIVPQPRVSSTTGSSPDTTADRESPALGPPRTMTPALVTTAIDNTNGNSLGTNGVYNNQWRVRRYGAQHINFNNFYIAMTINIVAGGGGGFLSISNTDKGSGDGGQLPRGIFVDKDFNTIGFNTTYDTNQLKVLVNQGTPQQITILSQRSLPKNVNVYIDATLSYDHVLTIKLAADDGYKETIRTPNVVILEHGSVMTTPVWNAEFWASASGNRENLPAIISYLYVGIPAPTAPPTYDNYTSYRVGDYVSFNSSGTNSKGAPAGKNVYVMRESAGSSGYSPDREGDYLWTYVSTLSAFLGTGSQSASAAANGNAGNTRSGAGMNF